MRHEPGIMFTALWVLLGEFACHLGCGLVNRLREKEVIRYQVKIKKQLVLEDETTDQSEN